MTEYLQLIGLTLVGGVISLSGGVILLKNKSTANNLAKYATPFAAGALLAAVFLDLLKEGLEFADAEMVLISALTGILLFFLLERFLHWFHHHSEHDDKETAHDKSLIIISDTLHNALDGVAIASAFLISPATGLVTAIAVAAHEIPQEIGDFGLLLSRGVSRRKVLIINIISALATVATAVVVYALGSSDALPVGALLGLSAGFLLYVAMSDVIPEIHEHSLKSKIFDIPVLLLLSGVLVVGLAINFAHNYIGDSHSHAIDCEEVLSNMSDYGPLDELTPHDAECLEDNHEHSTDEVYDHSPEHEGSSEHGY